MRTRSSLFLAALLALGSTAQAVEPCAVVPELKLTEVDESRLAALEASRQKGISEAMVGGGTEAGATINALFEQGLTPVSSLPAGDYQCRTIKLGGPFGAFTAYGWFACAVEGAGDDARIDKLSGSQRFSGDLIGVGGGLVFRGADHYADEAPGSYGADPERNSVGCVSRVSPGSGSYLLEMPLPFLESVHDVIELRPAG